MPTYVYACSSCQNTFETEQRITEPPLDSCQCGSKGTVKRVIQPVGISFKGSGFYINDNTATKPETPPATPPAAAPEKTEAPACTSEPASCPACSDKSQE